LLLEVLVVLVDVELQVLHVVSRVDPVEMVDLAPMRMFLTSHKAQVAKVVVAVVEEVLVDFTILEIVDQQEILDLPVVLGLRVLVPLQDVRQHLE
jgi:hypothetical protein